MEKLSKGLFRVYLQVVFTLSLLVFFVAIAEGVTSPILFTLSMCVSAIALLTSSVCAGFLSLNCRVQK